MTTNLPWTPWHGVVALRDDLKSGDLAQQQFAADLYEVVMQAGQRSLYEDAGEFFALTYPTPNLRSLVREVGLRLAGRSDKAVQRLELWYGGGKTHTLITLRHLHHDPASLPGVDSVREFEEAIGEAPAAARVAALCFDKLDLEKGQSVRAPDGSTRQLKRPWSVLAWQLAGAEGLACLHADGEAEERDSPPAENVLAELLALAKRDTPAVLILLDEVLMYARAYADHRPGGEAQLRDFLQYLTQAAGKADRCCVVASLLSTRPEDRDEAGRRIFQDLNTIVGRQGEATVQPVTKHDAAEVLRRRFFQPASLANPAGFKKHVIAALRGIEALDKQVKERGRAEEERFTQSYPFHPDLTEALYENWTQLDAFQNTRGVLRTFAMALRESCQWDDSPLIGPAIFLSKPGVDDLSEAAQELAGVATRSVTDAGAANWATILPAELRIARNEQADTLGLRHRELEKAVMATFLHSQPVGQTARTRTVKVLLGDARPDPIELQKGLMQWARQSHWLDDRHLNPGAAGGELPEEWRLGNRPNLNQMHARARRDIGDQVLDANLGAELKKVKSITAGASGSHVRVHLLPDGPADVADDGRFHLVVLGTGCVSESGKPNPRAVAFLQQTTGPDRPRQHVNAVVLLAPSRDGLEAARQKLRDTLAWERVQTDLQRDEGVDAARMQSLEVKLSAARKALPHALKQAWCVCVTVSEEGTPHAFKLQVGDDPTFQTLKNDDRSRMQEVAITADALLPDGPYDLWKGGETFRRVNDLAGAFSQFPRLPKMLKGEAILDTLAGGCEQGVFVLRQVRPDRSQRTFWLTRPGNAVMSDAGLELVLPDAARLTEVPPTLLHPGSPGRLPGLWDDAEDGVSVADVEAYFSGEHVVSVDRGGWEEPLPIPGADAEAVRAAVAAAVAEGLLWLTSGPASLLAEPVGPGLVQPSSRLRPPPAPLPPAAVLPANLPDAWSGATTTAAAVVAALSAQRGVPLPWCVVRDALEAAVRGGFLAVVPGSGGWPCGADETTVVSFLVPDASAATGVGASGGSRGPGGATPVAERAVVRLELDDAGLQDLADALPALTAAAGEASAEVRFSVEAFIEGLEDAPDARSELLTRVKDLLAGLRPGAGAG